MEECFKCGIPMSKIRLFDAISDEGIIKICDACSREEDIPIIRKPTTFQLKESERTRTFYEKATGHRPLEEAPKKQEEVTLREIVDRNYEQALPKETTPRPEMIDNFHWVIMRARRMKKLTQEQLAKEIAESEVAIKMAEKGVLPEDDYKLINKLESHLGIKIIRPEFAEEIRPPEKPDLGFDTQTAKELTIADLQRMKEEREEPKYLEEVEEFPEVWNTSLQNPEVEEDWSKQEEGLSQEDMDKIIFGK